MKNKNIEELDFVKNKFKKILKHMLLIVMIIIIIHYTTI